MALASSTGLVSGLPIDDIIGRRVGVKGIGFGGRMPGLARRMKSLGSPDAYVAAVQDKEETQEHLDKIQKGIECVPQNIATMIVQAVQDPGITRLYSKLLSNVEGQAGFRIDLPQEVGSWAYGDLLVAFKKHLNATLMAATETHEYEAPIIENPPWNFEVKGGMSLYYVASARIANLDFAALAT